MSEDFDAEAVYDDEIAPLMAEIIDICKAHRIPMLASFLYVRDGDGEYHCTTKLPFGDRQSRSLNVAGGVITEAPADGEVVRISGGPLILTAEAPADD